MTVHTVASPQGSVDRRALLRQLESVRPGLSSKEFLTQSDCFAFTGGRVHTFNDDVACSCPTGLALEGAVKGDTLLAVLRRMGDDFVRVESSPDRLELAISGERQRVTLPLEPVQMPLDEVKPPARWKRVPDDLADAITSVLPCAGTDASRFALTCLHFTPDHVEACDNFRLARYSVRTPLRESVLVRADSLRPLRKLRPVAIALTGDRLHLRFPGDLVASLRVHRDAEYPNLDGLVASRGVPTVLPAAIRQAAELTESLNRKSYDPGRLLVELEPGSLAVSGVSSAGSCRQTMGCQYGGPALRFQIAPSVLAHATRLNDGECEIGDGRLRVGVGDLVYVACLEKERDGARETRGH